MEVKVVNKSNYGLPSYKHPIDAGMDLTANISEPITLKPLKRALIPTGIFIGLPEGYEAQVRPRSGLAAKNGITVLNTPGTVDAGYTGEVKVILVNLSDEEYTVSPRDRIAQMVFSKFEHAEFKEVDELDESERGSGGFGSTGKN